MFVFPELCSKITKFLIKKLLFKIRQRRIERARRLRHEREALGQAMVVPIRRALDYQGIGRQLLMVQDLPQGGYASYDRYNHQLTDTVCSVCGGLGDNCPHLSYTERVFEEADRVNSAVELGFNQELDRDTNSAHREYNS